MVNLYWTLPFSYLTFHSPDSHITFIFVIYYVFIGYCEIYANRTFRLVQHFLGSFSNIAQSSFDLSHLLSLILQRVNFIETYKKGIARFCTSAFILDIAPDVYQHFYRDNCEFTLFKFRRTMSSLSSLPLTMKYNNAF